MIVFVRLCVLSSFARNHVEGPRVNQLTHHTSKTKGHAKRFAALNWFDAAFLRARPLPPKEPTPPKPTALAGCEASRPGTPPDEEGDAVAGGFGLVGNDIDWGVPPVEREGAVVDIWPVRKSKISQHLTMQTVFEAHTTNRHVDITSNSHARACVSAPRV